MDLKRIEDIQDGMTVFMPSGIQATLYNDGDFIIVEYPEMYKDKYTKEMFNDIIKEGVIVFNDNTAKESALMEEKKVKKITKQEWEATPKDYKLIKDGHKYLVYLDKEAHATVLGPCEIIDEAYENADNKPGDVFTNQQNKKDTQVTQEYKLKVLTDLTKLAKEYPDVEIRQQALTFMDELGLQEYYDLSKVDKFIDKYITELVKINKNESLQEEMGEFAEDDAIQYIADQIEEGITSGTEDIKFGHWLLETSLDSKMETIDKNVKQYLYEKIAQPIYDGHISYNDLEIIFGPQHDFSREELETLDVFTPDDLNDLFENGQEIIMYINYEVKYDNMTDDMEESFKLRKKKKNKKNLAEDNGLGIYVKNTKTNEFEGPYIDEDTAKEHIAQLIKSGVNEKDLIITNNKEQEDMKDNKMQEAFKVYNTVGAEVVDSGTFNSWEEVDAYLNQEWGSYCNDKCKQDPNFGTEEDKNNFLNNMEIEIVEIPCDVKSDDKLQDTVVCDDEQSENKDIEDCEQMNCPTEECEDDTCLTEDHETEQNLVEPAQDETEDDESDDESDDEDDEDDDEDKEDTEDKLDSKLQDMEDNLKDIENLIGVLLNDDIENPEEETKEKLQQEADNIQEAFEDEDLEYEFRTVRKNAMANPSLYGGKYTQKDIKQARKEFLQDKEAKHEDFSDNMGMLTDINDLDFPDALQKVVDTKEDGSLYKIADVAKEIQNLRDEVQKQLDEIKDSIKTTLGDFKQDLKMEVNNVENKVQDTKSAVDNLTTEEDELEDLDNTVDDVPPEPTEEDDTKTNPEEKEPETQEESFNNNLITKKVKSILESHTGKITKTYLNEELTKIGFNTELSTTKALIKNALDTLKATDRIVTNEQTTKNNSFKKFVKTGYLEDLDTAKKKVDQLAGQGKSAEEIKNAITLLTDNEKDEKQAAEYAVSKIKESLLSTGETSVLGRLIK